MAWVDYWQVFPLVMQDESHDDKGVYLLKHKKNGTGFLVGPQFSCIFVKSWPAGCS